MLGPFEINGVPLRRVNQAYVIATSTRIDVSAVTIPVKNDSYFARVERPKKTVEDQFFDQASKVRKCMEVFGKGFVPPSASPTRRCSREGRRFSLNFNRRFYLPMWFPSPGSDGVGCTESWSEDCGSGCHRGYCIMRTSPEVVPQGTVHAKARWSSSRDDVLSDEGI